MSERGRALPAQFDITEMVRQQEREYDRLLMACDQRRLLSEPSACGTGTDKIGD